MAAKKKTAKAPKKKAARKPSSIQEQAVKTILEEAPHTNTQLREKLGLSTKKYDPQLERKLQQMRKDGEIHLVNGRWAMATIHKCPGCDGRGWVSSKATTSGS